MQDIHSIGGGGGRFFGGGGVDRRLRPNNHQSHHHQALKCPRCDSLNTKFCYYNNYNLSQPRHFCKSCRRYWTKGGVLRNVPVGGGCRKTKRAKPKSSSSERKSNNSHSSSDSSSLTASTAAVAKPPATSAAATTASPSTSASTLLNYPDSKFFNIPVQSTDPSFDPPLINQPTDGGVFAEIGSFTSMMTSTNDPSSFLGFNIGGISAPDYRLLQETHGSNIQNQSSNHQWQDQQEISGGFFNQTAQMELSGMDNRLNNGVVGALDWQGGGDQGMFDLTGTVDQAYWSQTQWPDNDQSLYLP